VCFVSRGTIYRQTDTHTHKPNTHAHTFFTLTVFWFRSHPLRRLWGEGPGWGCCTAPGIITVGVTTVLDKMPLGHTLRSQGSWYFPQSGWDVWVHCPRTRHGDHTSPQGEEKAYRMPVNGAEPPTEPIGLNPSRDLHSLLFRKELHLSENAPSQTHKGVSQCVHTCRDVRLKHDAWAVVEKGLNCHTWVKVKDPLQFFSIANMRWSKLKSHCQNSSRCQRNRSVCGPNCESFFIAFTQNAFNDHILRNPWTLFSFIFHHLRNYIFAAHVSKTV
jgi:hypothetical protein